MTDSVLMADLTWPEFEARVTGEPVIFLPYGAFEQHGPHLPFAVDALLPTAIAEGVARQVGGLVASAITADAAWSRELTDATNIDRLNLGPIPTIRLNWLQPHEGNIVDFLFRPRAFQMA